jgi:hypothetical protein
MRLTIIPSDKAVYKDGLCYSNLDLSTCGIPDDIHALQWNEISGWLEFNDGKITEADAIAGISAVDSSVGTHLSDADFDLNTLQFHDHKESLVSSRIDKGISDGTYRVSNSRERAELHAAVIGGDREAFSKFVSRKQRSKASELMSELSEAHSTVKLDASGKMSVSGDGFKN